MEPVFVQVIARLEPTVQLSPPFGLVRARAPWILKVAAETAKTVESFTFVTRTFTVEEMSSGTVQANVPVFGAEAVIRMGVVKLSFEYSSLMLGVVPVVVQGIVRLSPTVHPSPPLGAARAREPVIITSAFQMSASVASSSHSN